jgi:hypothetical protein
VILICFVWVSQLNPQACANASASPSCHGPGETASAMRWFWLSQVKVADEKPKPPGADEDVAWFTETDTKPAPGVVPPLKYGAHDTVT